MARYPHAAADALHPDHIGLSWKILELTGARLLMHRADVAYLDGTRARGRPALVCRGDAHRQACRPSSRPAWKARCAATARQFRTHHPRPDARRRRDASPCAEARSKWSGRRATLPGHVCLYSPEHRYLISGDHVLREDHAQHRLASRTGHAGEVSRVARTAAALRYRPRDSLARRRDSRIIAPSFAEPPSIMRNAAARSSNMSRTRR